MFDATPLTLTYESFARLWKALVSRRRARRLEIDRDQAWAQLHAAGDAAPFLLADASRKDAKKTKAAKRAKPAGATSRETKSGKRASKRTTAAPAKKTLAKRGAKRPAARKPGKRRVAKI